MLSGVEAIHMSTVLEDCVDQLAILGRIMPATYRNKPDAESMVEDHIDELVGQQKDLEAQFEATVDKKAEFQGDGRAMRERRDEVHKEVQSTGRDLKNKTHVFSRNIKQSPLTADNLDKAQKDRAYLELTLGNTLAELSESGNFKTLLAAVHTEQTKKAELQETILKEEEGRKRIKQVQKDLQDVKKAQEEEVQHRNEMIAHLKDQLQEAKAKTDMEGKYIKKCADVSVFQTQKRCTMDEEHWKDEIDKIREKMEEENRVNAEIEQFLRATIARLQKKVEYWMGKWDVDVDAKQKELDALKLAKAKDLERLQDLTKLYIEYEQVVLEDRIEKEKVRRKVEQEAEELAASIRIQAWWRGMMVRRGLGPYKKKKGKKKGKGKKSGKKK